MEEYLKQLIEQKKRSGDHELEIIKFGLFKFPTQVFEIQHLKKLDLSSDAVIDNRSALLDEEFWWEVSFDNNEISSIPPEIKCLRQLEFLAINQNYISALPEEIGELKNLKRLELRNNYVSHLPSSIGNLTNLEYLDLSFNLLEEIPKEIGNCKNLKHLYLGCNNLKQIPPEIGNLTKLETFDISNFDIKKAFSETVERFDLTVNNISEIPKETANLKKIKSFRVKGNPLDENLVWFLEDGYKPWEWFGDIE